MTRPTSHQGSRSIWGAVTSARLTSSHTIWRTCSGCFESVISKNRWRVTCEPRLATFNQYRLPVDVVKRQRLQAVLPLHFTGADIDRSTRDTQPEGQAGGVRIEHPAREAGELVLDR